MQTDKKQSSIETNKEISGEAAGRYVKPKSQLMKAIKLMRSAYHVFERHFALVLFIFFITLLYLLFR